MKIKTNLVCLAVVGFILIILQETRARNVTDTLTVTTEVIGNQGPTEEHCRIRMDLKPSNVIFEDTTATLTCTITYLDGQYKNITVIWYKDNAPLDFGDFKLIDPHGESYKLTMRIYPTKSEQSGVYYCKPSGSPDCPGNSIQLNVLKELSQSCNKSVECAAQPRSICEEGYCKCRQGYIQYKNTCSTSGSSKSQDIYKAAMVALACFMVTIIGLFVLFLCNKSFLRRGTRSTPLERMDSQRSSDIFNIAEGLAAMRHVDKPPTYQQVVAQEMRARGCPPPLYTEAAPIFDRTMVHRPRPLDQERRPISPRDIDANSEPAILNISSSQLLERHADRGHINLGSSSSNNYRRTAVLSGSVNSAFVSDA